MDNSTNAGIGNKRFRLLSAAKFCAEFCSTNVKQVLTTHNNSFNNRGNGEWALSKITQLV